MRRTHPASLIALLGLVLSACAAHAPPAAAPAQAPAARPAAPAAPPRIPGMEPQPGETAVALDVAGRGRPDLWTYLLVGPDGRERVVRKEKDLDGDGRPDAWEAYRPDGSLAIAVFDLDFDGRPDVTLTYDDQGKLVGKDYAAGADDARRAPPARDQK
jgi:hypothetical protein